MEVRRYTAADRPAVVALLETSLGWEPRNDDRYERFFSWKHEHNPFGPSASWVAVDGSRVVAFRTFMRWEFVRDGERVPAVRAVDTATHPEYQGQGLFTRLTNVAVEELRAEGVAFVFNTPNDKSRPGYLKMGWEVVGRVPVDVRVRSVGSAMRVLRARVPAAKWSEPSTTGVPAPEALGTEGSLAPLLTELPAPVGISTPRSPSFLSWRYGFAPLGYRAVLAGSSTAGGIAVFRVRRRGPCREATICDVLVPGDDHEARAALVRRVVKESAADYAVKAGGQRLMDAASMRAPRQGPIFTWRGLAETSRPPLEQWRLALGDVELF